MAVAARASMAGDKEMKAKLRALAIGEPKLVRTAAKEWMAEGPLVVAKENCPVKKGTLRDSGRVTSSIRKKGAQPDIKVSLRFGGPGIPYAFRVHETHKTKAKFAERAIIGGARSAAAGIAAKIDLAQAERARDEQDTE